MMKVLVDKGYAAGDSIPNAELQRIATEAGIDGDDQSDALTFAGGQGWTDMGPRPATTVITQAGWENQNA